MNAVSPDINTQQRVRSFTGGQRKLKSRGHLGRGHLTKLKKLRMLVIGTTDVGESELLRQALPDCEMRIAEH
jgi:hypothetical protein